MEKFLIKVNVSLTVLLVALLLLVPSCGPKKVVVDVPVHRGFYAYVKISDATYHVLTVDQFYLDKALQEIGCVQGSAICLVEQRGQFYVVQQQVIKEK